MVSSSFFILSCLVLALIYMLYSCVCYFLLWRHLLGQWKIQCGLTLWSLKDYYDLGLFLESNNKQQLLKTKLVIVIGCYWLFKSYNTYWKCWIVCILCTYHERVWLQFVVFWCRLKYLDAFWRQVNLNVCGYACSQLQNRQLIGDLSYLISKISLE